MGKAALERPGLIQCQATEQRSGSLAQDFMGVPQQILVWEGKGGLVYSLLADLVQSQVVLWGGKSRFQDQGVLNFWGRFQRAPAVGTEIVQSCYNGLTVGAAGGDGGIVCLLAQQQPVGGHAEQPAHLCQIGHVGVVLARFP